MFNTLTSPYSSPFMAIAGSIALICVSLPAQAMAPTALKDASMASESTIKAQPIAQKRRYRDRYSRRYYRQDRDRHVVDAPFTRVESGSEVEVDAPFTYVYSGRHGRRIVAPFVDIYIPY